MWQEHKPADNWPETVSCPEAWDVVTLSIIDHPQHASLSRFLLGSQEIIFKTLNVTAKLAKTRTAAGLVQLSSSPVTTWDVTYELSKYISSDEDIKQTKRLSLLIHFPKKYHFSCIELQRKIQLFWPNEILLPEQIIRLIFIFYIKLSHIHFI